MTSEFGNHNTNFNCLNEKSDDNLTEFENIALETGIKKAGHARFNKNYAAPATNRFSRQLCQGSHKIGNNGMKSAITGFPAPP